MAVLASAGGFAQSSVKVSSPDRNICMTLSTTKDGLKYRIQYKGHNIINPSSLSFDMMEGSFGQGVTFGKVRQSDHLESYDLPVGKVSHVESLSREAVIPLIEKGGMKRTITMVVRAFNDGVAFRYIFPEQQGIDSLMITQEHMDLRINGDPEATVLPLWHFRNSHEGEYAVRPVSQLPTDRIFDLPATFRLEDGNYLSVTEANMMDYPGMMLVREGDILTSRLSPRLDRPELCVIAGFPHRSPWRVFMVSDNVGDFIKSTILTSLADPCKIEDTSWLKPGKTTFPWWCDMACADSTFQWGNNFRTNAYYVDFAAKSGLEYHSVYGFADTPWYKDDGPAFSHAGPNADLTQSAPTLDFAGLCRYAQSKGVDIHVWLNWKALWKDIDNVFDKFNEWGVKGMMVDFLDRDDQEMIVIQETILRKAAEHKLFIQFHGASKPSGLSRTYPNEFTREGALNYEFFKGDHHLRVGGDHDLNIPFTRLLAGPTDFHLGGFHAIDRSKFKFHNHEPFVTVSRCHMIAMYVVLEGYLSMVCDSPRFYEGQPGFDFLTKIPTTWDETAVPAVSLNEYVAIARRKGDSWWLGAITGLEAREVEVKLDFLGEGQWKAEWLSDTAETESNPNILKQTELVVSSGDSLTLSMVSEGGAAVRFTRMK